MTISLNLAFLQEAQEYRLFFHMKPADHKREIYIVSDYKTRAYSHRNQF